MSLAPGTRLGTYEITALLGAGGMGEVYRAVDLRLGRDVALKVLPADVAADPDRLARLEREARAVAGLNHPNIVTLYAFEDDGGLRFLSMELVEGESLDSQVTTGGLPIPRVIDLGIGLADALVAAHEKRVIHRDLKPANVMLTRDGRVKVLDFGLAKLAAATAPAGAHAEGPAASTLAATLSGEGQVRGTAPYMAPEQIRGQGVDARTDLFALGVVLFELAAGRRPFAGATFADVSSAILRDTPPPLADVRSDSPGDLERIVGRCLEKNPRDRFQTALDLGNELRGVKRALERGEAAVPARRRSDDVASIAVLPFLNRSRDPDDEYFSDGLADELLGMLSKIRGVRVAARTSSFTFKGKDATIAEVGRALNVRSVLEGSVRRSGSRVRISVQLAMVADGHHAWSETYDRTLDDIFAVQDDIARTVVKELRARLLGETPDTDASGEVRAEVAQAAKGRGTDPEAHRLFLQARHLLARWNREGTDRAISLFVQALEVDPGFAAAWAELAGAYAFQAGQGWIPFAQALAAAERSLTLEPELSDGHMQLGRIRMLHGWDWHGAESSYRRALELAPGNVQALRLSGLLSHCLGRVDEAEHYYRRVLELDPVNGMTYSGLAWVLRTRNRLAEAEAMYRTSLEFAPQYVGTRASLALVLLEQGRGEEAVAEARLEPGEFFRHRALASIHHRLGQRSESDEALAALLALDDGTISFQIAEAHAARGERDAAFHRLEQAYAARDGGLPQMRASSELRPLHDDPRWAALLVRMNLDS